LGVYQKQRSKGGTAMRARTMLVGVIVALPLAVAAPASAKVPIAIVGASITGPGLGTAGGIRIDSPAADQMWHSGIVNDSKWSSLSEFRVARSDLGPRYLIVHRVLFVSGPENHLLRQELYPYAKGGPVTYTPPGQELLRGGARLRIVAGWYEVSTEFLEFLVGQGLPSRNPLAPAANPAPWTEPAADAASGQPAAWVSVMLGTVGLAALSLAAPKIRRRVLAGANH
jgi:hypothetical protein